MIINKKQDDTQIILSLKGRLDKDTATKFQDVLLSAFTEMKEIIIDFKELIYVSSKGLRVLLMGQKTANAQGTPMTVTHVSEEIMEVFEITGFSDILTIT